MISSVLRNVDAIQKGAWLMLCTSCTFFPSNTVQSVLWLVCHINSVIVPLASRDVRFIMFLTSEHTSHGPLWRALTHRNIQLAIVLLHIQSYSYSQARMYMHGHTDAHTFALHCSSVMKQSGSSPPVVVYLFYLSPSTSRTLSTVAPLSVWIIQANRSPLFGKAHFNTASVFLSSCKWDSTWELRLIYCTVCV